MENLIGSLDIEILTSDPGIKGFKSVKWLARKETLYYINLLMRTSGCAPMSYQHLYYKNINDEKHIVT